MIGHTVAPAKRKKAYHYYLCPKKSEGDWKTACPNRNHRAADLEAQVREFVVRLLEEPDTLREQVRAAGPGRTGIQALAPRHGRQRPPASA